MNNELAPKPPKARRAVCTIAAKNYMAHVRVLCASVAEHNPGVDVFALIVDDWQGYVDPAQEGFRIVSLSEIALPNVEEMAFKYDVVEFSTAVKPFLLHALIQQGYEQVLYLDPDILVTDSLDPLFGPLADANFVVTPHAEADYPDDNRMPNDSVILTYGLFNLGFFGLRAGGIASELLRWWQNKLLTKCVRDSGRVYFVDQKFIDLAFVLFPGFHIVRHLGCNVAYWNLHTRRLTQEAGRWRCNGQPLIFFHFSSFQAHQPDVLSPHCTRFGLEARPDIKPLFREYRRRLEAAGYDAARHWPYGYGFSRDGKPIPVELRRAYRQALADGKVISDPFASKTRLKRALGRWPWGVQKSFFRSLTPPVLWRWLSAVLGARRACPASRRD